MRKFFLIPFYVIGILNISQNVTAQDYCKKNVLFDNVKIAETDSGKYITSIVKGTCKNYTQDIEFIPNSPTPVIVLKQARTESKQLKLLTIHGSISYDYFYRSKIDTPFNQQDFQQHTERIYVNVLVKEKYPFKVNVASRQSNSSFFRDFFDFNIQFDRYGYKKNVKQQLINKLEELSSNNPVLKFAEAGLQKDTKDYLALKKWIESPATLQKIIKEREHQYNNRLHPSNQLLGILSDFDKKNIPSREKLPFLEGRESFTAAYEKKRAMLEELSSNNPVLKFAEAGLQKDTKDYLALKKWIESPATLQKIIKEREHQYNNRLHPSNQLLGILSDFDKKNIPSREKLPFLEGRESFTAAYEKKRAMLDSFAHHIKKLQQKTDSIRNFAQKNLATVRQRIYKASDDKELKKILQEYGLQSESKEKFESYLTDIKSFSIGRSTLNYTELTAQNITVTGVNIEYNPSYYTAFAAGKIDYRFRDFLNRNKTSNGQYIVLGRIGLGNIDKKALIFSFFKGRKNQSEFILSDSTKSYINIIGYSLEAILKKNENTSISAEIAKSSKPVTGSLQSNKEYNSLWKFGDKTNMGVNVKAQTLIPETDTKISGFFRKTGENFQSFSLFSYNTNQTAWLARVDQYLLKRKIAVTGMLRQNDFVNPFTDKTFKTSTTFKTLLLHIRFPKYPSLSIGYYPGTQLYIVNKERIRENAYYILNGSLVYSYSFKDIKMNTSFALNRYFNQATDSGFVLYKGINYYASQAVLLKKFQLQGGYAYTRQPELEYYTLETSGDYSFKKYMKMGVGAKYNKVSNGHSYWGERIQISIEFKQFGVFQLQYEKSYLPTLQQSLYPIEIGRVSWHKYF